MTCRTTIWAALAAALALPATACLTDDVELAASQQPVSSRADTLVSLALARAVAEIVELDDGVAGRHVRTSSIKLDANQRAALYGFNFEEGGYVVVAADLEFAPILAYATSGLVDVAAPLPGQDEWADEMRLQIEAVRGRGPSDDPARAQRIASAREEREAWQPLLDRVAARPDVDPGELARAREVVAPDLCFDCPPPPPKCTSYATTTRGPLLTTEWGQACNFNQQTPGTSNFGLCLHAPTGCAPTAMGQVVRYHRHAANHTYDWNMPAGATGGSAGVTSRARLLHELGLASSTQYGTTSSSTLPANARAALQQYGYASTLGPLPAALGWIAIPEIQASRPILLLGYGSNGGHIWVVDGTKQKAGIPEGCKPSPGTALTYYHYNWGWDGSSNGWYKDNSYGGFGGNRWYLTARPI